MGRRARERAAVAKALRHTQEVDDAVWTRIEAERRQDERPGHRAGHTVGTNEEP
jgi:hypothetical protein